MYIKNHKQKLSFDIQRWQKPKVMIIIQTCPTWITEGMTTSSSMQFITRIGFEAYPASQLFKIRNKLEEIQINRQHRELNSRQSPIALSFLWLYLQETALINIWKLTSLASGNSTTGFSNNPTALRTFSSSANHSSWTLLTLLQIEQKYKFFETLLDQNVNLQKPHWLDHDQET